jgi:hypothetical protein
MFNIVIKEFRNAHLKLEIFVISSSPPLLFSPPSSSPVFCSSGSSRIRWEGGREGTEFLYISCFIHVL